MTYVDGFVLSVPKKNTGKYTKMAQEACKVWMRHGALQYVECKGEDLKGMPGCGNFLQMFKPKKGETIWFSWIMYKNKAHRNKVNKTVMKVFEKKYGKDMKKMEQSMPFDMKRMAYGGFKALVKKQR